MAISAALKDYIARELGIGDCFVYSGLSWTVVSVLGDSETETGGTGKLLSRIISSAVDHVDVTSPRTKTFRASDLPGAISLADIMSSVLTEDKNPASETQYCAGGAPPDIYKQVKIVPPAGEAQEAYISDIQIPSEMTIGTSYSGAVFVNVATPGQYKAELLFRQQPAGWDGNITTLAGASGTITTEAKALTSGTQNLNWTWTVPNIPGDFIIVSVLYRE